MKRSADRTKRRPAKVREHMLRMASAPMPDDFGTQLSTYMDKLGRKPRRRRRAAPKVGKKR